MMMKLKEIIVISLLSVIIILLAYNTYILKSVISKSEKAGTDTTKKAALSSVTDTIKKDTSNIYRNAKLTYTILNSNDNTFGYDIFVDGTRMVHQLNIPGMPGNKGFSTKANAEKVAGFIIEKIRKGEMPPTITPAELIKLKVLDN